MKSLRLLPVAFFVVLGFMISCNNSNDKPEVQSTEVEHSHVSSDTLALNNGDKWKADSATNHNVIKMKMIAENFSVAPFPSMDEYKMVAADLQTSIDTMMRQCSMKGEPHDQLHKWLEPLIKETKELKNAGDTTQARPLFTSINERIHNYKNYFE